MFHVVVARGCYICYDRGKISCNRNRQPIIWEMAMASAKARSPFTRSIDKLTLKVTKIILSEERFEYN